MSNRPRRLRDYFAGQLNRGGPSSPRETDELLGEIAETHEIDIEDIAREAMHSHRRLWHKVEDELEKESRRRD